jgi:hypothetical protein
LKPLGGKRIELPYSQRHFLTGTEVGSGEVTLCSRSRLPFILWREIN